MYSKPRQSKAKKKSSEPKKDTQREHREQNERDKKNETEYDVARVARFALGHQNAYNIFRSLFGISVTHNGSLVGAHTAKLFSSFLLVFDVFHLATMNTKLSWKLSGLSCLNSGS